MSKSKNKNRNSVIFLATCALVFLAVGGFVSLEYDLPTIVGSEEKLTAQLTSSSLATNTPLLGFTHFYSFGELETAGDLVRTPISWGAFQPKVGGPIVWNNGEVKKIADIKSAGKIVFPILRATGENVKNNQPGTICGSAPKDLEDKWNPSYGHSKSYYAFVKAIAERYKGEFPIVGVENEAHDPKFWCSDEKREKAMDDYIRVLKTARKAFRDVIVSGKTTLITDSGVQGGTLAILALNNLVKEGRKNQAIDLYKKMSGASEATLELVTQQIEKWKLTPTVANGIDLVERAKVYSYVDRVNFHHYQSSETLPESMMYLKKITPGKIILSSELGRRLEKPANPDEKERISEGAKEMVRKIAILSYFRVRPLIWYSGPARADYVNAASFFEPRENSYDPSMDWEKSFEGIRVSKTMKSYRTAVKFLNRQPISVRAENKIDESRYIFEYPNEFVTVAWKKGAKGELATTNPKCRTFLMGGEEAVSEKDRRLSEDPIYVICPR